MTGEPRAGAAVIRPVGPRERRRTARSPPVRRRPERRFRAGPRGRSARCVQALPSGQRLACAGRPPWACAGWPPWACAGRPPWVGAGRESQICAELRRPTSGRCGCSLRCDPVTMARQRAAAVARVVCAWSRAVTWRLSSTPWSASVSERASASRWVWALPELRSWRTRQPPAASRAGPGAFRCGGEAACGAGSRERPLVDRHSSSAHDRARRKPASIRLHHAQQRRSRRALPAPSLA